MPPINTANPTKESIGRGVPASRSEAISLVVMRKFDVGKKKLEGVRPVRVPSTTVNLVETEEFAIGEPLASTSVTVTVCAPGVSPVKV